MTDALAAYQALIHHAERDPDRTFLNQPFDGQVLTWTFRQAVDQSRRLAQGFLSMGLAPGDKVAILSKNTAEWLLADYAIAMAGLISVPIYPTAGRDTIAHVLRHSEAKAIIVGKLDDSTAAREAIDADTMTVATRYTDVDCQHDWTSLIESNSPLAELHEPVSDETMTILYTSGSTGQPKGVVISYGAYHYASITTKNQARIQYARSRFVLFTSGAHYRTRRAGRSRGVCRFRTVFLPIAWRHSVRT